jgi:hypothetical protein
MLESLRVSVCSFGLASFLLFSPATASAAGEVWFCTYSLGTQETELNVASKFEVRGSALWESNTESSDFDLRARYTILQNDGHALIAAVANAEIDPHPETALVGAVVLMIDNRTGAFQFTGAPFGRSPVQKPGVCSTTQSQGG